MSLIPFVNTATDRRVLSELGAARVVRTGAPTAQKVSKRLDNKALLWVDGHVDGFENTPSPGCVDWWTDFMSQFNGWEELQESAFKANPKQDVVGNFTSDLLDHCRAIGANWISVPQLPIPGDTSRNKINRMFAKAAGNWKAQSGFSGTLVLPVVLLKPQQVDRKKTRDVAVNAAANCFARSGASGVWVAVIGINDQAGSRALAEERFGGVISLHREIARKLPNLAIHVGGPYWALNLVLWARGLITHAATGLGSGYQYQIPGLPLKVGSSRVALPPLRRLAVVNDNLRTWFESARKTLGSSDPAWQELAQVASHLDAYEDDTETARRQVVRFYRDWYQKFASTKAAGRPLALYQDLSEVFVLGRGRGLHTLKGESNSRRPEWLVQALMSFCLPED